jgi:hypothetical protein
MTIHRARHRPTCTTVALVLVAMTAAWAQDSASSAQALPDSPGAVYSQAELAQATQADNQSSAQSQTPEQGSQTREPVGTAAAEAPATTGVAGSEPAGAAVAPAKQRRVRMLVIKMAAVVGAGAAVGVVAALAIASPGRPPGTH